MRNSLNGPDGLCFLYLYCIVIVETMSSDSRIIHTNSLDPKPRSRGPKPYVAAWMKHQRKMIVHEKPNVSYIEKSK